MRNQTSSSVYQNKGIGCCDDYSKLAAVNLRRLRRTRTCTERLSFTRQSACCGRSASSHPLHAHTSRAARRIRPTHARTREWRTRWSASISLRQHWFAPTDCSGHLARNRPFGHSRSFGKCLAGGTSRLQCVGYLLTRLQPLDQYRRVPPQAVGSIGLDS